MVSEKTGNIASVGGGLLIFFTTAILLGFMTDEYNKGKKYESLMESHQRLKDMCPSSKLSTSNETDDCRLCKFPFVYQNKSHSDCLLNELNQQYWCPTELDAGGKVIGKAGHWTNCPVFKCAGCKYM